VPSLFIPGFCFLRFRQTLRPAAFSPQKIQVLLIHLRVQTTGSFVFIVSCLTQAYRILCCQGRAPSHASAVDLYVVALPRRLSKLAVNQLFTDQSQKFPRIACRAPRSHYNQGGGPGKSRDRRIWLSGEVPKNSVDSGGRDPDQESSAWFIRGFAASASGLVSISTMPCGGFTTFSNQPWGRSCDRTAIEAVIMPVKSLQPTMSE
jgi:hypothetical protein